MASRTCRLSEPTGAECQGSTIDRQHRGSPDDHHVGPHRELGHQTEVAEEDEDGQGQRCDHIAQQQGRQAAGGGDDGFRRGRGSAAAGSPSPWARSSRSARLRRLSPHLAIGMAVAPLEEQREARRENVLVRASGSRPGRQRNHEVGHGRSDPVPAVGPTRPA